MSEILQENVILLNLSHSLINPVMIFSKVYNTKIALYKSYTIRPKTLRCGVMVS